MITAMLRSFVVRLLLQIKRFHDAGRHFYWSLRLGNIGQGAYIYPRAIIYTPRNVYIGRYVSINDFVHIRGAGGVFIGDECLIAPHVVITSESHDIGSLELGVLYRQTSTTAAIHIGRNVWLGAGCIVMPGVSIGEGSVVAAGAVVLKDVSPNTLVAGVPAKFVRLLSTK